MSMSVTIPAAQEVAPDIAMADLGRSADEKHIPSSPTSSNRHPCCRGGFGSISTDLVVASRILLGSRGGSLDDSVTGGIYPSKRKKAGSKYRAQCRRRYRCVLAVRCYRVRISCISKSRMKRKEPNQALLPTIMSVTIPADAGLAPAMIAADL
jgi:hypothetical protein